MPGGLLAYVLYGKVDTSFSEDLTYLRLFCLFFITSNYIVPTPIIYQLTLNFTNIIFYLT